MGAVATLMSLPSVPAAKLLVREATPRNGDVESLPAAPVDPLFAVANPTDGDVEAPVDASLYSSIDAQNTAFVTKLRTASPRRG